MTTGSAHLIHFLEQFRIGHSQGNAQHNHGVKHHTDKNGNDHNITAAAGRKGKFFRRLRHGIKPHEEERRERKNAQHAGGLTLVFRKIGHEVGDAGRIGRCGSKEESNNAEGEHEGQYELQFAGHADTVVVEPPENGSACEHEQHFAYIHLPAGDGVQLSEFKYTGKQEAEDQRQRGNINHDDGDVANNQRPSADERRSRTIAHVGIGERATGNRGVFNHIAVTDADKRNENGSRKKTQQCTKGACLGQKHITWKNETAPAYDGAEGQRRNLCRRQSLFEFYFLFHESVLA